MTSYRDSGHVVLPMGSPTYPLRINPHLESLREDCETWAVEMGMLSKGVSAIWDPPAFTRLALEDLAAFCFPDAEPPELTLIHQTLVWMLAWDAYFTTVYKIPGDLAGAQAFTERLHTFLPANFDALVPNPTNPIEKGIHDLWPRTCKSRSADWRRQYTEALKGFTNGGLLEMSNIRDDRIPDLVEYVRLRRETFGAAVGPLLVDIATKARIPKEIRETWTISILLDAFADSMTLVNDIYSYHREIHSEGEVDNLVLVLEHFLGCDTQTAMYAANDLVQARLRHFDHITDNELPQLVERTGLDLKARENLATWVRGARSYLSGHHAWTTTAAWYMESQ